MDALKECTFRPDLSKGRRAAAASTTVVGSVTSTSPSTIGASHFTAANSTCIARGRSRPSRVSAGVDTAMFKLRRLVDKQNSATSRLQALASEEADLQERLSVLRTDLRESIQEEETRQVMARLQINSSDETQHELDQQVVDMVADESHPGVAQQQIVEELVARSQDEVCRRVQEAFSPLQQKATESINNRRYAIQHELEAIEVEAAALLSTCRSEDLQLGFNVDLAEQALQLGFDPDLAERSRSNLHMEAGSSLVLAAPSSAGPMNLQNSSTVTIGSSVLDPPELEARPRSP